MIRSDPTTEPRPGVTWTPADTESLLRERRFDAPVEPWTERDTEALRRELDAAAYSLPWRDHHTSNLAPSFPGSI